jgi:hypothetical protein
MVSDYQDEERLQESMKPTPIQICNFKKIAPLEWKKYIDSDYGHELFRHRKATPDMRRAPRRYRVLRK